MSNCKNSTSKSWSEALPSFVHFAFFVSFVRNLYLAGNPLRYFRFLTKNTPVHKVLSHLNPEKHLLRI